MNSKLTYLKKLELFKELDNFKEGQFFAIADLKVKNHLPQWIQFSPNVFWLKNPEEEKNLETYGLALEFFLKQGIQRSSCLYAFGGGATTDFSGFIASTIQGGIKWVAVPTTLVAMVDASIGGKVSINMPSGKNLVGCYHNPETVYLCGDFLKTLSEKELISGKGEILKYGFISKDINDAILKKIPIEDIAVECAKIKSHIVEHDFKDNGERAFLTLGHTLGHAFETTIKLPHGYAVAMGLKYLFKILKNEESLRDWEKMVKAMAMPIEKLEIAHYTFDKKIFMNFIEQDKKKVDSSIKVVMVKGIGACYVEEMPMKELKLKILTHEEFKS